MLVGGLRTQFFSPFLINLDTHDALVKDTSNDTDPPRTPITFPRRIGDYVNVRPGSV
jgi:hypothetical protein